ncbi:MAG: hypothetical protein J5761_02145 [Paludibacteraceae bacterium]|nr:hypothetical protein [Paludibacteraceae bacterium]
MARIHKPPDMTLPELAESLRPYGITIGQQLPDGTYRAYVRKDHLQQFLSNLNIPQL